MTINVKGTVYSVDGTLVPYAVLRFRPVLQKSTTARTLSFLYPSQSTSTAADMNGQIGIELHSREDRGGFSDEALYVAEYLNPETLLASRLLINAEDGETVDISGAPQLSFEEFVQLRTRNKVGA